MKKIILIILVLNSIYTCGQNDFSKNLETKIVNDSVQVDFFKALFSIDSLISNVEIEKNRNKVQKTIKFSRQKEKKEKHERKRIKRIYNTIHNTFLEKYNIEAHFSDIFINGNYNCVSATALYSYVFESLEIPYKIKETPTHVYLVVYPKSYKIYIETTVPGEYAYLMPKKSKIKEVVDELVSYKLVTQNEVLEKGYQKFYEDYFYGKESIQKESLIGIQFYNQGLFYLQEGNEPEAYNYFEKAKHSYQSPFISLYLKAYTINKIFELKYETKEDVSFFIEVISDDKINKELDVSDLKSILYKITKHKSNQLIRETLKQLQTITDLEIKMTCLEFLYEYLALEEASNENYKQALLDCDELLNINKDNKKAKQIVEYFIFKKVHLSTLETKDLEDFEYSCEKYPFIKSNNRYPISLAHLYANISLNSYQNSQKSYGEKYRMKFENVMDNNDIIESVNKNLISQLYLKAGNYYYYKSQYRTSYPIYKKGLSYLPYDSELLKKSKWSKEEFKN